MSEKVNVRASAITPGTWVGHIKSNGFVQPDGTSGLVYFFDTQADAQKAADLYEAKQVARLHAEEQLAQQLAKGQIAGPQTAVEIRQFETGEKLFGHSRFYEILEKMKDLHSRKNHDYAGTSDPLKNLRACERLELEPFMGVMVRLQDKWSRLEEFVKSGKLMVKGESVIDTLLDNAVYSVLAIILYEEQQKEKRGLK